MPDARQVDPHEVVPFLPERNGTIDTLRWAKKRHTVSCLLEIDVTAARQAIRAYRSRTGSGLSFTAWTVSCVARAAAAHPRVHAVRQGRRRMVLFQDVDVAVLVEREIGEHGARETLPMPHVIRKANEKTPQEIHQEIRQAQTSPVAGGAAAVGSGPQPWLQALFFRLPGWIRDLLFWRWLFRSPMRLKQTMGTVVVTATSMAVPGVLAWGLPLSVHPLAVGLGGIAQRTSASGTTDTLALTVVFDHEVTDGVPVGKFIHHLHRLLSQTEVLTG
jgi:chloramphenicol O-acetyltransferase